MLVHFGSAPLPTASARAVQPASEIWFCWSILRTGVVKIGSGSTFLDGVTEVPPGPKGGDPLPLEYAGVALRAMGKA